MENEIEELKTKVERIIVDNKVVSEVQALPDRVDIIDKINEIIRYLNNKEYNEKNEKERWLYLMNKEEIEEDNRAIKISMPLLTEEEMLKIDNNFNEIVDKIKNQFIKEKDLAIAQYIINKQQNKLEQKESILDKVTEECRKQMKEYEDSILEIFPQKILKIIEGEKK